jgi:hypothetical protein
VKENHMKVQDLINELQQMDPEHEVMFQYNYGDYWHTEVAQDVKSVRNDEVVWSEYHRMNKVVSEMESNYDEDESESDTKSVVILSSSGW